MRLLAAVVLVCATCAAPPHPAEAAAQSAPDRATWWRQARFGLFIHWGLYAIPAGSWDGRTDHGEWIRDTAHIPLAEYDKLTARFDAPQFDADRWAELAAEAGMKYLVITTKYHDGFCLWDSAQTDFDVMATPLHRDVMAATAAACRKHGLRIGWYHSIMDWHHPDYLPRRPWETDRPVQDARFSRYVEYLHRQVAELLNNYGPIDVMWFDGEWENTWTTADGRALYQLCRSLQPAVLVDNRVDKGRAGMEGMTRGSGFAGDFGTPEQEVPAEALPGVDWETCLTMNDHWGFNRNDRHWKSVTELVRTLVDVASKGGNLLLGVGPEADGTFPSACVDRLQGIGAWMSRHGEAIHGSRESPFGLLPWGRCTWKPDGQDSLLYLMVFERPGEQLLLPGLGSEVVAAEVLGGGAVKAQHRSDGTLAVELPDTLPDPHCSVVRVRIHGAPVVYRLPRIAAPADVLVQPMAITLEAGSPELELRYTLDGREPDAGSRHYRAPFAVRETTTVRVRAFHHGRPVTPAVERTFERVRPLPAEEPANVLPGLRCASWPGDFDRLPDFQALGPARERFVPNVTFAPGPAEEHVARLYTGFLRVPQDAVYTFALVADDGARLSVAGQRVVDNDGLHPPQERRGQIALAAGLHPLRLEYFNKVGGAELQLSWAMVGQELAPVPDQALAH
jgi:alpha-L-fucosidase